MEYTLAASRLVGSKTCLLRALADGNLKITTVFFSQLYSQVQRIGVEVSWLGVAFLAFLAPSPQGGSGKSLRCVGPEGHVAPQKTILHLEGSHGRSRIGLNPCKKRWANWCGWREIPPFQHFYSFSEWWWLLPLL